MKVLMVSELHITKHKPEANSECWQEVVSDFDNVLINGTPLATCIKYPTTSRQFSSDFFFDFVPYYDENEDWLFWCMDVPIVSVGVGVNYPFIHPPQQLFSQSTVTISRIVCYHKCLPICFVEANYDCRI